MEIKITDKKLAKCLQDDRKLQAEYGKVRAGLIKQRIAALRNSHNLEECRDLPGHFEELRHDRKGEWSCRLDNPFRLIFRPLENPIPTNKSGAYIWVEILGVEVTEIVDYHPKR